jgi:hypothetical protein
MCSSKIERNTAVCIIYSMKSMQCASTVCCVVCVLLRDTSSSELSPHQMQSVCAYLLFVHMPVPFA